MKGKNNMNKWNQKRIKDIEPIIDDVKDFLDFLGESSFTNPLLLILNKNYIILNQFTISLQQTFYNIEMILLNGNYSNAFALLRQFRDDLLLYLVMIFDSSNSNKEIRNSFTVEDLIRDPIDAYYEFVTKIHQYDDLSERIALKKWFDNSETKYHIDYKYYLEYLLNNPNIKNMQDSLDFTNKLKKANEKLNGYTHSKNFQYFINNATWVLPSQEIDKLNQQFKEVLLTIIEYSILVMCHIKPVLLSRQYEPEEIKLSQALDYSLDYRVDNIISRYSNHEIQNYINLETVFAGSFKEDKK